MTEEDKEVHKREAERLAKVSKQHFEAAIAMLRKSIETAGPDSGIAFGPAEVAMSSIMQGLKANTSCEWHLAKLA